MTDLPLHYHWCIFGICVGALTSSGDPDYLHFITINAAEEERR